MSQVFSSAGRITTPTNGQVLAGTGALEGPSSGEFGIIASANANLRVLVQRRNAANTATVTELCLDLGANDPVILRQPFELADQERIRVVADQGLLVGDAQVTIVHG